MDVLTDEPEDRDETTFLTVALISDIQSSDAIYRS
jgi:hypothetical protein